MRTSCFILLMAGLARAVEGVGDGDFIEYDLASFKTGLWVECEHTSEETGEDGKKVSRHSFTKLACIRANEEWVSVEETTWDAGTPDDKTVTQYLIRKSDRLVTRAWRGKPGAKGEAIKVFKSLPVIAVFPKGTIRNGKVTNETLEVAGEKIEVIRIEVTNDAPGGEEGDGVETVWIDKSAPFSIRWDDPKILKKRTGDAKLDQAVASAAAVVRSEIKWSGGFYKNVVTAKGNDAKPSLTTK